MKVLWLLGLLLFSAAGYCGFDPVYQNIETTFDRMSGSNTNVMLWDQTSGGYEEGSIRGGSVLWKCDGTTTQYGQCNSPSMTVTYIKLRFTEKRSGMSVDLTIEGHKEMTERNPPPAAGCGDKGIGHYYSLSEQITSSCSPSYVPIVRADETLMTAWIPPTELAKIPTGGVWEAELHLQEWVGNQGTNYQYAAPWQAKIRLQVVDPSHIDIYFPEFSFAAPQVELDLRPVGAPDQRGGVASDVTWLEMCLYDGYNANSTQYEVKLQDEGQAAPGRASGDFSIYHSTEAGTDSAHRIDYHVRIKNPETNSLLDVENGTSIIWTHINENLIRPVRLPSINYPVLCVPTPLQFSVAKFNVMDKAAGYYKGTLTVIFTPTTPTVD